VLEVSSRTNLKTKKINYDNNELPFGLCSSGGQIKCLMSKMMAFMALFTREMFYVTFF